MSDNFVQCYIDSIKSNDKFIDICKKSNLDELVDFYNDNITHIKNFTIIAAFLFACGESNTRLVAWLYDHITDNKYNYKVQYDAIIAACQHRQIAIFQFLLSVVEKNPTYLYAAFNQCCISGSIEIAKWLLTIYPDIDYSVGNYDAIFKACENDNVDIVQWLLSITRSITHQMLSLWLTKLLFKGAQTDSVNKFLYENTFVIDRFDVDALRLYHPKYDCLAVFKYLAKRGWVDLAKVFFGYFYTIRPSGGELLSVACESGQLEFAKWIDSEKTFKKSIDKNLLLGTILAGQLDVAKWLQSLGWNLRSPPDYHFYHCVSHNYIELAKWLKNTYTHITPRYQSDAAIRNAWLRNDEETVYWLLTLYKKKQISSLIFCCYYNGCTSLVPQIIEWFDLKSANVGVYQQQFNEELEKISAGKNTKSARK